MGGKGQREVGPGKKPKDKWSGKKKEEEKLGDFDGLIKRSGFYPDLGQQKQVAHKERVGG